MTILLPNDAPVGSTSPQPARPLFPPTPELRVVLRRPGGVGTFLDGGWWPHSLDLVAELPPLLAAVEAAGYSEIRRVSYALNAWNGPPSRKAAMLDRVVKLGGFRYQDAAEITLIDSRGWRRVCVLVVPPTAAPPLAQRALAMAGTDGDRRHAREILDLAARSTPAHSTASGCVDELAAACWDADVGRVDG
ncbi:MAG TPA: DUF5994 family protein [Solirubrobacteraceae bacterium]|nr:DUF5994 family protein [Solirubrobacteraceae bacterium]